ncbi:MAG: HD-GYP domain-containing protein [Planctomycetes bacterium]|nr:HD-GYP domain-containing protein [Planctomycetota bacterium]
MRTLTGLLAPEVIQAMVGLLEAKDMSTAAHTWRVVLYTRALAEKAGLNSEELERLTVAAALHDIGKIEIPSAILQKPGKLTEDEFEIMKTHTILGHDRLLRMGEDDRVVLDLVRHHHERFDGLGYPDRLTGDRIPVAARYFAVIDSFDAMTSIRPYRKETGVGAAEKAIAELESGIRTRYCPGTVEMFVSMYRTGELGWILEYFNDNAAVPKFSGGIDVAGARKNLKG